MIIKNVKPIKILSKMSKILHLLITLCCMVIVLPSIAQKKEVSFPDNPVSLQDLENSHPRILVNDGDKQNILSKIENQEWAKKLYGDLLEKIEPIADRHTRQPDWILSRYQMYRIPGKYYTDFYTDSDGTALIEMEGNAPAPTIRGITHKRPALDPDGFPFRNLRLEEFPVNDTLYEMFLQSTAPSGEWYWTDPQRMVGHINGTINTICLESAIIYWLTGEEKYAKLASDIIVQWVNGAYYQNPYQGACRDGFFAVQSLDDLAYATLPVAFDFLYDYLKQNEAPLDKFDAVFERLTQTHLERGFWNNNWFAAQSPVYIYSALAISDKEKRDKYLHYFMYEDHINGICGRLSLKTTCERWLTPDGHWKEPGGYHNFPVGNILQASVAAEKNGYPVFAEFPPLYRASYVMMRYLFPNKKVMAFGDTRRGTMDPKHLEIAIAMAGKYNDPVLPTLVTTIKQLIEDGYKREDAGWFGLLNYVGALPASESSKIELPRTGTLDFAKCFYQRNGVDEKNGMMCYVQGATYNHNHCNGIAMELYGQGVVLGNDPGIGGHYDTQIHKEYYALFAAHNTVIAAGKSGPLEPFRGSGGRKPMGASELNVMEPLPDHTAVSPYCSFTSVDYLEPSTQTNQKRTLALIRTSERTGYYVDIFHSDNKEKNEYLYHNLGNSLKLFDKENNLIPMFATDELSEHVDGYGPGYKHFDKKLTTNLYGDDVKAHFRLDVEGKEDIFMDMHITGGTGREYFTAMAPKSYTAPSEYSLLPNPVAVVRQNGDAWDNPFMVVYESYTGEKNSSITNVSGDSNGETSVLKVESESGTQTIIQSFSKKAYQSEDDFFAGHFGVISSGDKGLSYLYIGDGTKISSGDYSIEARGKMRMNANMELKNDRIMISSNQQAIVYLPSGNKENIIFEVNGEKKEVKARKTRDNLWKMEIPPVINAVIYK
jgi:hypothetical protein